jgi:hypothetical protein
MLFIPVVCFALVLAVDSWEGELTRKEGEARLEGQLPVPKNQVAELAIAVCFFLAVSMR